MKNLQSVGLTLPPALLSQLDEFASGKGVSRSEAARAAIQSGLPLVKFGIAIDAPRILTILEHTQLALSLILQEEYPDDAQIILNLAEDRVKNHHG